MFKPILEESILKRAQQKGKVKIYIHNLRDFSRDRHKKVDDRPFGGGPGMVMRPEPIFEAVEFIRNQSTETRNQKVILLSPQGKKLGQDIVRRLVRCKHLILICGHYEGIDERVRKKIVDEDISIGDYVLTGGELPALVLIDAIVRLIPGVVGNILSTGEESFSNGLLEYPHYTRPRLYKGMSVPSVLLSGNHARIEAWRRRMALKRTRQIRPDLLPKSPRQSEIGV
jgi:tRNA (guanine37-N1)-methyltransferase